MEENEQRFTLKEVAGMSGVPLEQAVKEVCNCDLCNGLICMYHQNQKVLLTMSRWAELASPADQYEEMSETRVPPLRAFLKRQRFQRGDLEALKGLVESDNIEARGAAISSLLNAGDIDGTEVKGPSLVRSGIIPKI